MRSQFSWKKISQKVVLIQETEGGREGVGMETGGVRVYKILNKRSVLYLISTYTFILLPRINKYP